MADERIKLNMTVLDVITAMSEGNPGAVTACVELLKHGEHIDPDAAFGGLDPFLGLDTLHIWGSRLYMLWNDVCDRDVGKMIAVLRAYQFGQLAGADIQTIHHAIDNRGEGLNLDAVVSAVQECLPNFNPAARAPTSPSS